ncbi:hypothetical protein Tco_1135926 [Tanacetum coccineum]
MSGTVPPPIPPPLGTNSGNVTSPDRVDPIPVDNTNNTATTNVVQNVNDDLPQLLDSRGESHVTNFITEIVARRANECIVSITEPDYKNLNKNDIEDMYLLIMNGKVPDYVERGLLWSLSVFIRSVEKHKMFSIIYEPVHGIIYKNSKKEKRVMRHSKIHKELTNDEVEYLKLFEEEIEVRLKVSQPDEKMGDVCECKTTWTTKGMPIIIDP